MPAGFGPVCCGGCETTRFRNLRTTTCGGYETTRFHFLRGVVKRLVFTTSTLTEAVKRFVFKTSAALLAEVVKRRVFTTSAVLLAEVVKRPVFTTSAALLAEVAKRFVFRFFAASAAFLAEVVKRRVFTTSATLLAEVAIRPVFTTSRTLLQTGPKPAGAFDPLASGVPAMSNSRRKRLRNKILETRWYSRAWYGPQPAPRSPCDARAGSSDINIIIRSVGRKAWTR